MSRKITGAVLAVALSLAIYLSPQNAAAAAAPAQAAQVGYTSNTFSSTFSRSSVDLKNTKNKGFQWYLWNLFSFQADPANIVLNSDGSVTLLGIGAQMGQLMTAITYTATNTFAGTAFGGGAYFEASMKFDPKDVAAATAARIDNWPAFWSMQLEGNITGSDQWPGQSAHYVHRIEADFFEAGHYVPRPASPGYGGSMHDWYGVYGQTCGAGLCEARMTWSSAYRVVPTGTDFSEYHRYGFLWVPATSSSPGYAKYYFDGKQLGPAQQWTLYTNQSPPAADQSWAFGVLDQKHLFLTIGTGRTQPLTVQSVNVWQAGTSSNLAY